MEKKKGLKGFMNIQQHKSSVPFIKTFEVEFYYHIIDGSYSNIKIPPPDLSAYFPSGSSY